MIFKAVDPQHLQWQDVRESFWINLQICFDEYRNNATTDIDRMAIFLLEETVFCEDAEHNPNWCLEKVSAMAIRRMYFHCRLKATRYDAFLYQFEEMIQQIEGFFREHWPDEVDLTPLVPPEL